MSGRLKISTKKSYCPWSTANVAKYEKEEERLRASRRKEEEKLKIIGSGNQWHQLLHNARANTSNAISPLVEGHIHLFPPPPECQVESESGRGGEKSSRKQKKEQEKPFYLKAQTDFSSDLSSYNMPCEETTSAIANATAKQRMKHEALDPMRYFHSEPSTTLPLIESYDQNESADRGASRITFDERSHGSVQGIRNLRDNGSESTSDCSLPKSQTRKKNRKRARKEPKRDSITKRERRDRDSEEHEYMAATSINENGSSSLEELRLKRLKREQQEQQRQSFVVSGNVQNRKATRKYNNQYFPGIL